MPLADVIVRRGDRGSARLPLDDVATRFEAVISERGPVGVPIDCRSVSQLRAQVGGHTAFSTVRAAESYFAEGGSRVVLSRVVGPNARNATLALRNGDAAAVLTVVAAAPGAWYHGFRVTVGEADGDDRVITITLDGDEVVAGSCADEQEAQDLIASSGYLTADIEAGSWPLASISQQPLAGGDDDRANIRDADVIAALEVFDASLGAGSVCASAWTSVAVHTALADHAAANNRLARADLPDSPSAASLVAHANQIRSIENAAYVQLLAGWPTVTVGGVTLAVPPSGVHTGREARTDRETGPGAGQPCAWSFGEYATPIGVNRAYSRVDREAMADAGITVIVQDERGAIYAEDAITAVDPARYPQYAEVSAMRVTMAIHAQAEGALRAHVLETIDGKGRTAALATSDLAAICSAWYSRNALFGETASEAYSARVEAEIPASGRARLVGHLELRPSPSAHTIELTITQVAAGDTI